MVVELGPDGNLSRNVVTVKTDGTDEVKVTDLQSGSASHPAWTPDGRIVYALEDSTARTHWNSPTSHIVIAEADGSKPVPLTSGPVNDIEPTVSTDGTAIAFARQIGDDRWTTFIMRIDGTEVRQVSRPPEGEGDEWPTFSPDAKQIAFDRTGGIYVIGVDGTGERRVTPTTMDASRPRWSPDGTSILFNAQGLYRIRAGGSEVLSLGIGADPDWSPDGRCIVYQRWTPGTHYVALAIAQADGSGATEVWTTPPNTDTFVVYPTWASGP